MCCVSITLSDVRDDSSFARLKLDSVLSKDPKTDSLCLFKGCVKISETGVLGTTYNFVCHLGINNLNMAWSQQTLWFVDWSYKLGNVLRCNTKNFGNTNKPTMGYSR